MVEKTDNWDAFGGTFLKAQDVKGTDEAYIVVNVSTIQNASGKDKVRLSLERNGLKKDLDLNLSNIGRIKALGVNSPKELMGKKLYFEKVMARSPQTGLDVSSLRVFKLE